MCLLKDSSGPGQGVPTVQAPRQLEIRRDVKHLSHKRVHSTCLGGSQATGGDA